VVPATVDPGTNETSANVSQQQQSIEMSVLMQERQSKKKKERDDKNQQTPPTQSSVKIYSDYQALQLEKQEARKRKDDEEKERVRRSKLIFGTDNMHQVIAELNQKRKNRKQQI